MTRHDLAVQLASVAANDPSDGLIASFEANDDLMALAAEDMDAALAQVISAMHARLDMLLWELRMAHAEAA